MRSLAEASSADGAIRQSRSRPLRPIRHRFAAACVAIGLVSASCGGGEELFVPFAVAFAGEAVDHDVVSWTRSASEGTVSGRIERGVWNGAMVFDGLSQNVSDVVVGRFAHEVHSDGAGHIGWQVDGSETSGFLFDPDRDGAVDLAIYRHVPDEVMALSGFDFMTFLAFDHAETAIARSGLGAELLAAYESYGLAGIACSDAVSSTAGLRVDATTAGSAELGAPVELSCGTDPDTMPRPQGFAQFTATSAQLPRQAGFQGPCATQASALQISLDEGIAIEQRREADRGRVDRLDTSKALIETAKILKKVAGEGEFLEKLADAANEDAQLLVLTDHIAGKLEGEAVKEMINLFGPSDEGQQRLWANVYSLLKAAFKANPVGAMKAIVDVHIWAGEQALRVAEILNNANKRASEANAARQAGLQRSYVDCLNREEDSKRDNTTSGRGKGEPHLTTFDGYGYDFQAVGEFVLAAGDDFEVQVRYGPIREGNVSVAVAVGFVLPGATSSVFLDATQQGAEDWMLYIDGEPRTVAPGDAALGRYSFSATRDTITFSTPGSVAFELSRMETDRALFNITEVIVDNDSTAIVEGGLLGTIDGDSSNDLMLRDGTVFDPNVSDFRDLYEIFGESWRISEREDSLMLYEPGEGPDTFFNPRYPEAEVSLSTLTERQLFRGLEPCLAGGVWIEPALSDCAFDVAILDDDLWVEGGLQAQRVLERNAVDRELTSPAGVMSEPGSHLLWQRDGVRLHGFVTRSVANGATSDVLRGLLIETPASDTLIWPGWHPVPSEIDLDADATLSISRNDQHGLVVVVDGPDDGAAGLLVDDDPDGDPVPASERWASAWLEVVR